VAEVTAWQSRSLERLYPVVFFDALRVKIRDEADRAQEKRFIWRSRGFPTAIATFSGSGWSRLKGAKF
jgi:hypothetical protein